MPSSPPLTTLEQLLRRSQLRVTRPRMAVLGAVHARPHSDTDTILRDVRGELGQVSHQAVYDVLRALSTAGLVRRIQPLGHLARYEARVADNHHHAVCRGCGTISDIDCAVGEAPCLTPVPAPPAPATPPATPVDQPTHGLTPGFVVDEAEVIYWGLCPDCATAAGRDAPDAEAPGLGVTNHDDHDASDPSAHAPDSTTSTEHPPDPSLERTPS